MVEHKGAFTQGVNEYLENVVRPNLARRPDDGDKATFLGHELLKFEKIESRLNDWIEAADGSPNPYWPPLDLSLISEILAAIEAELDALREHIKSRIQEAEATLAKE